jgi:hypothetical protein
MSNKIRIAMSAVLLLSLIPRTAWPDGPLDGDFEIHSAFVVLEQDVLKLSAHVQYPLTAPIRSALRDGVTLAFDLDLNMSRHRRLWLNSTVLDMTLRRELTYHAVTDRYVLRDESGAEQASFPTLEDALDQLGRVEDLPILVKSQLRGDGPWLVSVRAGVRRGRMPDTLRILMFWNDGWHRTSDWYTWILQF